MYEKVYEEVFENTITRAINVWFVMWTLTILILQMETDKQSCCHTTTAKQRICDDPCTSEAVHLLLMALQEYFSAKLKDEHQKEES